MRNLAEPGPRFRAAASNHPKLYWKNPKLFKLLGKKQIPMDLGWFWYVEKNGPTHRVGPFFFSLAPWLYHFFPRTGRVWPPLVGSLSFNNHVQFCSGCFIYSRSGSKFECHGSIMRKQTEQSDLFLHAFFASPCFLPLTNVKCLVFYLLQASRVLNHWLSWRPFDLAED